MKININVPEEMAIRGALQSRIDRLEKMGSDDPMITEIINDSKRAYKTIVEASHKEAQEIMRNEG